MPSPLVETVESSDEEVEVNQSAFLSNQEAVDLDNVNDGGLEEEETFILPTQYPSSSDESEEEVETGAVQKLTDLTSDSDNPMEKVRAAKRVKRKQDSKRKMDNYQNWLRNGSSSKSDSSEEEKRDYWAHDTADSNSAPKKKPAVAAGLRKSLTPKLKAPPKNSTTLKSTVLSVEMEVKNSSTLVKNYVSRKFKEFTKTQKKMHQELKEQQEQLISLYNQQKDTCHILLKGMRGVQASIDSVKAIVDKCPHKDEKPPCQQPKSQGLRGSGGPENFRARGFNGHHAPGLNQQGNLTNTNQQGNVTASPHVTVNNNVYNQHADARNMTGMIVDLNAPGNRSMHPVEVKPGYGTAPNGGTRKRRLTAMSMALIAEQEK
ncbi:unknown protein [Seminavis robusta]|uniref:Uncharacterized protein n=1 Tax=Seminavis robusta TaxID=568900 RepID=A0A9N8F318_9STRA|nr:unknown protein [Seminavis robusta]|eukprot:Sro3986_g352310.1 n/a (375) ;mRNA; f:1776-2900